MTMLRCRCGERFSVQPHLAGEVVVAPCCQAKVRIPAAAGSPSASVASGKPAPSAAAAVLVRCPCGQKLRVRKSSATVDVDCPKCHRRLKVGGSATAPQAPVQRGAQAPARAPAQASAGAAAVDNSLFDDPLFGAGFPPAATSYPASFQSATGSYAPPRVKKRRTGQTRLPRWGAFDEGFGAPILFGGAIVLLVVLGGIGISIFQRGSWNAALASDSEKWIPAEGQILDSGYTLRASRKGRQVATIHIRYQYRVAGATYTGSNLSFENHSSHLPDVAKAILKPYPPGATCTVYHDPQSPTNSVLERGSQSGNQLEMVIGIAIVLCGLFFFYDCVAGAINALRFS